MNSIYDSFQTVSSIDYYTKQIAKELNLDIFSYYWDNINQVQIPNTKPIRTWQEFYSYPDWKIKFNLTKPKTIQKMGINNYVLKYHELKFNLTIRGYSILYIVRFSDSKRDIRPELELLEEDDGQLRLVL